MLLHIRDALLRDEQSRTCDARVEVEQELHEAGIIEDPDVDGGLLG